MSETMTASERALNLVSKLEEQWFRIAPTEVSIDWPVGWLRERNALLAYVAALEEVAAAARISWSATNDPDMRAALAALDRPEDGDGDQG